MAKYNVYHRKDGRWEGRISRGKRDNGKRKYQYIFGRTKNEVLKKIDIIIENEQHYKCQKTFNLLFKEWSNSIKHRIKESTFANYLMKANKHILPYFREKNIVICYTDRAVDKHPKIWYNRNNQTRRGKSNEVQ